MNESTLFGLAFLIYISAAFFYFSFLFSKKEGLAKIGYNLGIFGLIVHTAALVIRTIESGHAPFTNMYESLSFLAWSAILAYVIMEGKYRIRKAGPYFMLIVIGLMALASSPLMPAEATPLVPALQSYWLWLHVSVTMLGEAFFAVAFVTSILYLIAESREKKGRAEEGAISSEKLDSISYRSIAIGFPLFTLGGLIFGMVWAYKAWGTYWSWDPKEVWSLITWFVFALYLHTRIVMGWKGRRSAIIAILGFLAALFTYFGVNYLLSGLHSYA
jgi:cytochrome c-type biogenesis protein CcsB